MEYQRSGGEPWNAGNSVLADSAAGMAREAYTLNRTARREAVTSEAGKCEEDPADTSHGVVEDGWKKACANRGTRDIEREDGDLDMVGMEGRESRSERRSAMFGC